MDEKWLEISKQLEKGQTTIVCPFCNKKEMNIVKVKRPDDKYDVYLQCPKCYERGVFSGAS